MARSHPLSGHDYREIDATRRGVNRAELFVAHPIVGPRGCRQVWAAVSRGTSRKQRTGILDSECNLQTIIMAT